MDVVMSAPFTADFDFAGRPLSLEGMARPMLRVAGASVVILLLLAAAFLWVRRATGAISTPLTPVSLIAVGGCVAVAAFAAHALFRRADPGPAAGIVLSVFLTVGTLAFAAATSLPGSAPFGLVGLWGLIAAEELWAWRRPRFTLPLRDHVPVAAAPRCPVQPIPDCEQFEQAIADSALGLSISRDHVTQQVTRLVEPDGTERVVGWMRVCFEPGQRLASVHLAFCPPFGRTPEAALERLEGPQVRIKRVQVFPFGARFDLKLGSPSEQHSHVLLQVAAELPAEVSDGAASSEAAGG